MTQFTPVTFDMLPKEKVRLVEALRERVIDDLPPSYDHKFNLLRWINAGEKQLGIQNSGQETAKSDAILNQAEQSLRHHFRLRKAMKLDSIDIPSWDENPMFKLRLIPRGHVRNVDKKNRLVWWIEYTTLDLKGVLHSIRSSDMVRYHFYQYEELLRLVVEQERKTGRMSAIHHVGNLEGYGTNPFTMLFVSNGQLAYYATLLHFEHYPELVNPIGFVNTPRWLYYVYRMVRSMSPVDIFDRFRLIDSSSYQAELLSEIDEDQIPDFYGGTCPNSEEFVSITTRVVPEIEYYSHDPHKEPSAEDLVHLRINARRRCFIPVDVAKVGANLSWYFKTDGELYFGIFLAPFGENNNNSDRKENNHKELKKDIDSMTMIEPFFRCSAKLVPERGAHVCETPGTYYLVFCNKGSWMSRRNVYTKVDLDIEKEKRFGQRTLSV